MDEEVLCVEAWYAKQYKPSESIRNSAEHFWCVRSKCENDTEIRQIIPYCAIRMGTKFLVYDRKGTEDRLHGFASMGVGGHIKKPESFWKGMDREIEEEAGVTRKLATSFMGTICRSDSPVNSVHLGVCYLIDVESATPKAELVNPRWLSLTECAEQNLEDWSRELLFFITKRSS